MYTIKRHIAPVLEKRFKNNICLSINGARQVGKSTLCNHLFPDAKKVNFDNKIIRMAALEDEAGFLNNSGTPLFIDEAQKAPSIFEAIKDKISYDNLGYSSYVLSGSQKLKLHAGTSRLTKGSSLTTNTFPQEKKNSNHIKTSGTSSIAVNIQNFTKTQIKNGRTFTSHM